MKDTQHFRGIFRENADLIKELCNSELGELELGFKLGIIHTNLDRQVLNVLNLEENIESKEVDMSIYL